jgi:hypothetical protein
MSAVATAGAAAWVVPEILTAKPAAGANLSGPAIGPTPPGSGGPTPPGSGGAAPPGSSGAAPPGSIGPIGSPVSTAGPSGVTTAPVTQPSGPLAYSGLNIERDAEVGAALIAGGWAMHHWASRTQEGRPTA